MYTNFILDVDGCLNNGVIYWNENGKPFKAFGNYDHDGLKMLCQHINIKFITADATGWDITYSRVVTHMGFELFLVKEKDRYNWVEQHNFKETIYMGDGFYDAPIIRDSVIGIAPRQARVEAREAANYVTPSNGGEGAVMDACLFVMEKIGVTHERI